MKILIVDDSPIMRNVVKNSLTTLGYDPAGWREAGDGEAAWAALVADPPDVILLDWNMPNLDGYELLKRVRADERFKHLAVVMATSENNKTHLVAAIRAGATDYLIKPVREDQLGEKLMHIQNAILLAQL